MIPIIQFQPQTQHPVQTDSSPKLSNIKTTDRRNNAMLLIKTQDIHLILTKESGENPLLECARKNWKLRLAAIPSFLTRVFPLKVVDICKKRRKEIFILILKWKSRFLEHFFCLSFPSSFFRPIFLCTRICFEVFFTQVWSLFFSFPSYLTLFLPSYSIPSPLLSFSPFSNLLPIPSWFHSFSPFSNLLPSLFLPRGAFCGLQQLEHLSYKMITTTTQEIFKKEVV